MTGLPSWAGSVAALDDDALAALANKGLVRRAHKEVARFEIAAADETAIDVRYTGTPPASVTVRSGGPRDAVCGCPVAGVCLHIVGALLAIRAVAGPEAAPDAGPAEPTSDVEAELLSLDPATVNRAAGIAAVRAVAGRVLDSPTDVTRGPTSLRITWPDAPEIMAVPGGGFAGLLVPGTRSDTADRALRLEAMVRLWARNGRSWSWPDNAGSGVVVHEGQREAMTAACWAIESILRGGLSRARPDATQRLAAAAQRARLEDLPLLGQLLTQAGGRVRGLSDRDSAATERATLTALARAWSLGRALQAAAAPLPSHLVGTRGGKGEPATVGTLVPLAIRWWQGSSGSRGFTLLAWDADHALLETVTTGRAAGADPSFRRSWEAPLLWGLSAAALTAGPFELTDPERRDDGTLSPTSRTRARSVADFRSQPVDLDQLARTLEWAAARADADGFRPAAPAVRLVRPARLMGVKALELDEVQQQLVWPLVARDGQRRQARVDAAGHEAALIGWLVAENKPVQAVLVDDNDTPLSVVINDREGQRLLSPSLTPVPSQSHSGWFNWSRNRRRQDPAAYRGEREASGDPLVQACEAILDVCEALAATGRPAVSAWQHDALAGRAAQLDAVGLTSLAIAVRALLADPTAPAVLRATVLAVRLKGLIEAEAAEPQR